MQNEEKQIVEDVLDELKKLGDNVKIVQEKQAQNYHELKFQLDNIGDDYLTDSHINKLTSDISLRQNHIDNVSAEKRFSIEAMAVKGVEAPTMHSKKTFEDYQKSFKKLLRAGDIQGLSPEDKKTLQVGIDPDGGYLVSPAISNRVIKKLFETDPMRQLATVENISTHALEILQDVNETGANWTTETREPSEDTTPDWKKARIVAFELEAIPQASRQLIEDSAINIENWISSKLAGKFQRTESAAFITGDGIGKPKGVLSYDSGTDFGQIEQIVSGNATALTADGFINCKYALIEQYLSRGTWLMNRLTLRDTMKLKDGAGAYIWKPGLIATDANSTLVGLPVQMSTTFPIVAANALSVGLADWSEAYTIVDRLGITVMPDPYSKKPMIEFYGRKRTGGGLVNSQAIKIMKISA